jgi:hypothetical protein
MADDNPVETFQAMRNAEAKLPINEQLVGYLNDYRSMLASCEETHKAYTAAIKKVKHRITILENQHRVYEAEVQVGDLYQLSMPNNTSPSWFYVTEICGAKKTAMVGYKIEQQQFYKDETGRVCIAVIHQRRPIRDLLSSVFSHKKVKEKVLPLSVIVRHGFNIQELIDMKVSGARFFLHHESKWVEVDNKQTIKVRGHEADRNGNVKRVEWVKTLDTALDNELGFWDEVEWRQIKWPV